MQILIIEDHPMIVDAYIRCLKEAPFLSTPPHFTVVSNCKEGFEVITSSSTTSSFELALIDQNLPSYEEEQILDGSQLALVLQMKHPTCKVMMITSHCDVITVYGIVKKVRPQSMIIKSDVCPNRLLDGIFKVLNDEIFYSPSVDRVLREIWSKELMINDTNREILLYLSKGYRIQDMEKVVFLSLSAIKRRIAQMKELFEVSEDSSLVKAARIQGFI